MSRTLSLHLDRTQTALLTFAAAALAAVAATQMREVAASASSFMAFCTDVLVADWGSAVPVMGRASALAAWSLIVVSAVRGAWFAGSVLIQGVIMGFRVRAMGTVVSGKAQRAADAAGVDLPDVIADAVPYAFTSGLLRPTVLVSAGLVAALSQGELAAVLRHEEQHRRSFDPMRAFLGELVRTMFFWVPLLRDVMDHFALGREIAADRAAARGADGRRLLASALLKTTVPSGMARSAVFFGQFSHRVDALAYPSDRTPLRISAVRLAATAGILAALVAGGNAGAAAGTGPASICVDAASDRTVTAGFTPFVLVMTDAAPMSEAGQSTPDVR